MFFIYFYVVGSATRIYIISPDFFLLRIQIVSVKERVAL
jgi:hypothetical protein